MTIDTPRRGGASAVLTPRPRHRAMRRASLIAGAGIFLVGVGALAFVRPWGLRLPRRLVIIPALTGSAYAASHALTAFACTVVVARSL